MIKNWDKFILENLSNLDKIGHNLKLKKYDPSKYKNIDRNDIEDNFYMLSDYNVYLSTTKVGYIDKDGFIREDIKIGESLKPCILIEIRTKSNSKAKEELINDIKMVIKKIKYIYKFKTGNNLSDLIVLDPQIKSDRTININSEKLNYEDPFSIISTSEDGKKFKYSKDNDKEVKSLDLEFCMVSDSTKEITDEDFYIYYELTGADAIDKDGELWYEYDFKEVADFLFKDKDYVEKYFMPEDWDFDNFNVEHDYIISEIVDSISNENKKNYLTKLFELEEITIDDINKISEESYKDLNDLIENITDSDLRSIIEEQDDDMTYSLIWSYNDILNSKYQKVAEDYIRDETLKYIDKYIEFDYVNYIDKEKYKEYIWIKYDPIVFEYGYKEDDDHDDWGNWGDRLHGEDIGNSIYELLDEHSNQIHWNDYIGDNIWISRAEIDQYIKDVLNDY